MNRNVCEHFNPVDLPCDKCKGAAMNREDIERMAREAKGHPYTNRYTPGETAFAFSIDRLEHFASLVYARGFAAGMKNEEQITREEVAAEREACAKAGNLTRPVIRPGWKPRCGRNHDAPPVPAALLRLQPQHP